VLAYETEVWIIINIGEKRSSALELILKRRTAGYTLLHHRSNGRILEELEFKAATNI
jgi:hypothetical protein